MGMSAINHEFDLAGATMLPPLGPVSGRSHPGERAVLLGARWDAIHAAGDAVAELAQLGRESMGGTVARFPARAAQLTGWRGEEVATRIEDLAFVMQTGLRALIVAAGTGCDTTPAAVTLWREFHAARAGILAIAEPDRLAA